MSDFKKALHQYKTSLAFSLFNGGEKSRVSKILDDIDRHEHLAQSMFEAGQQSMQAKIDDSEVALKEALAWVEDLKRERAFLQKKCVERADRIEVALHYAKNRKLGNGISGDDSSDLDYIIRALHGDFEHD